MNTLLIVFGAAAMFIMHVSGSKDSEYAKSTRPYYTSALNVPGERPRTPPTLAQLKKRVYYTGYCGSDAPYPYSQERWNEIINKIKTESSDFN